MLSVKGGHCDNNDNEPEPLTMDASQPKHEHVTVTCFVCDSRNYFKFSEAGTTAACEMCGHELVVPDCAGVCRRG